MGPHTASLGITFSQPSLPAPFTQGLFIGQHGSWNRNPKSGYKVIFVPFAEGKPSGDPVDLARHRHRSRFLNGTKVD